MSDKTCITLEFNSFLNPIYAALKAQRAFRLHDPKLQEIIDIYGNIDVKFNLKYIEGDLFNSVPYNPQPSDPLDKIITVIPHICNNVKAWGAGFVVPLGKRYPSAKTAYLSHNHTLGECEFLPEENGEVIVANMVAQEGIGSKYDAINNLNIPPIRYDALETCMKIVATEIDKLQIDGSLVKIACPMFGSGLAGGNWSYIEGMIKNLWIQQGICTEIYYLPQFLPAGWTLPT